MIHKKFQRVRVIMVQKFDVHVIVKKLYMVRVMVPVIVGKLYVVCVGGEDITFLDFGQNWIKNTKLKHD